MSTSDICRTKRRCCGCVGIPGACRHTGHNVGSHVEVESSILQMYLVRRYMCSF